MPLVPRSDASPLAHLQHLFSSRSRARGVEYAEVGRVEIVEANHAWLLAEVRGTRDYELELEVRAETLFASCTCPVHESREACKHLWATLLVLTQEGTLPALRGVRRLDLVAQVPLEDDEEDDDPGEEDGAEDDAGPFTLASVRSLRPSPSPPVVTTTWRDVLASATSAPAAAVAPREHRFVIDADATRGCGRLVINAVERVGQGAQARWGPARLARPLTSYARGEDALTLGMLEGLRQTPMYYAGMSEARFDLPASACGDLLRHLCASGRLHMESVERPALRWDEAPYALSLEVAPGEGRSERVVRAWFERGDERVAAPDPALVLAGGHVFWPDRVAPFDDGGQFAWVVSERQGGPVVLPESDADDFIEAVYRAPRAPALRLPPELALREVHVTGRPYARLTTPRQRGYDPGWVTVDAGIDYEGVRAPLDTSARGVVDRAGRRLLLRDQAAEASSREALESAGARPVVTWDRSLGRQRQMGWRLALGRLEATTRELVGKGWRVEVDGKLRRRPGTFAIDVTTGIDWLDVRLQATFDGVGATLPALLAAVRERRRTVVLADGSEGELSDPAIERLRRWAGMGEQSGETLRFRKVQTLLVAALAEAEEGVSFDAAFERARAELSAFDGVKPLEPPRTLKGALRPYQKHGLGWLEALRRFGFGGCLADDMGLGKTVQVLAMLDARRKARPRPGASLVVAPRSVLSNWASEAARFTPGLRVLVHDGTDRLPPGAHFHEADLVLTTYGLMRQDAAALSRVEFDYVVLDEAQAIKTARTASAKAARRLHARHRLALTGTPIENHLGELASLLDFLNPGLLGTAAMASLAQGGRRVDDGTRDVLARAVRPFFLRRTKRQVAPELPDRVEQTLVVELPPAQRRLYDELHVHYRASLKKRVARDGVARSTAHILEALLRLRQAACHPGLLDPARRGDPSAKLDALLEQLDALMTQGQKALVFSQFTSFLAIVRERLDERGIVYEYLDGATRDRAERVARFQADETCGVFLLSLKAGGVGLNLTAAEYVFLLDPWWNPAVEAQAIDRAHRIGQTRNVFACKLLAKGTVEEKVAELQAQKRELADALFGEGGAALTGLTREDLEQLLG